MLCPFDATTLQVVNRSGVEIDWCPSCKGVWLERGELDKLIDQADAAAASAPSAPPYADPRDAGPRHSEHRRDRDDDDWDDGRGRSHGYGPPKKRKNLLSEIFDF